MNRSHNNRKLESDWLESSVNSLIRTVMYIIMQITMWYERYEIFPITYSLWVRAVREHGITHSLGICYGIYIEIYKDVC